MWGAAVWTPEGSPVRLRKGEHSPWRLNLPSGAAEGMGGWSWEAGKARGRCSSEAFPSGRL